MGRVEPPKADCRYGAPMGRPFLVPEDPGERLRIFVAEAPLDEGGYDAGGAYWGLRRNGANLYWFESQRDDVELAVRFFPGDRYGRVSGMLEAGSREEAERQLKVKIPGAKIVWKKN